jgi:hypothetical protein
LACPLGGKSGLLHCGITHLTNLRIICEQHKIRHICVIVSKPNAFNKEIRQNNFRREGKMKSKQYRSVLVETTDEHLRHEFLKLIAQEGRQHYMLQIAEKKSISDPSPTALLAPQTKRPLAAVSPKSDQVIWSGAAGDHRTGPDLKEGG